MLILNTNSDLNLYKEMGQKADADDANSCCGNAAANESKAINKLTDVDFNLWTGELRQNETEHKLRC